MLNDLPGLPGGQQEGTGSNGEPSGGLIPEAGQLLTLGLVQRANVACRNNLVQWRRSMYMTGGTSHYHGDGRPGAVRTADALIPSIPSRSTSRSSSSTAP